ncbi:F-box/WD repeat-containing protein 8 isoform X2 [Bos indicus]|uniref:F-box and WD repeat domain containing 8 n=2 Tax=Bos TaxID=9903 RepID=A0A4W2IBV2_BOBOX|nr:F-box/WD repeat-containing protein 8 isoform X1 [Bos taurus]XP_027422503.1 F-box/WD repeat-containing protein 8 isoform X2 [Bos indicus x Bos taurus]XP_061240875.1 F-box/WD repeat-containing protein 8 isoform X2 [Bos javanicus]
MDDHSLDEFRRRWQEELAQAQALRKRRRPEAAERRPRRPEVVSGRGEQQASGYLALAQGLLEGAGRPPAARATRAERQEAASRSRSPPARDAAGGGEQLVDQLIRDLNEMDDVPFFDIQLPYELAINIFQYLNRRELGRCAQNRKGAVSELEHIPDAVLCDVHSHDGVVIAGYTSGDVRVWDTRTWDYTAPFLESEFEEDEPGMQPYVSFVRINSSLAVAAYEDGFLNIWNLRTGKYPIHRFEHDARIQALALSQEDATIATASAFDVVMLCPNEEGNLQIAAEFEVQKLVDYLEIVPDTERYPVAVATAGDLVYLLKAEDSARTLHYVYGQPVTCLDVSANQAAFGVKSLGWVYEGNKILVYSLEAERCVSKLGNALGDFSCVNLRDSPPSLMVSGNMDRRVRIHDLRTDSIALSISAHQLGVSAVQMDDWKIVSGGEEGLVSVWDYRMSQKLWEVHSRHPVRHISFNSHSLITAHVPYERVVRNADLDNFATHRRHRGLIQAYAFAVDQLAFQSTVPVCRSACDAMPGYNYDLALAFPPDSI